jgi:hypothetical protein
LFFFFLLSSPFFFLLSSLFFVLSSTRSHTVNVRIRVDVFRILWCDFGRNEVVVEDGWWSMRNWLNCEHIGFALSNNHRHFRCDYYGSQICQNDWSSYKRAPRNNRHSNENENENENQNLIK